MMRTGTSINSVVLAVAAPGSAPDPGPIAAWGHHGYGQRNVPAPNTGFVAVAAGYTLSLGPKVSYGDVNCDGDVNFGDINPFVKEPSAP